MNTLTCLAVQLADDMDRLHFNDPVAYVYNPIRYAWRSHAAYLERFGKGTRRVMFLGMNPGPWGMAQTGVPFGEVAAVRDWMGIDEAVDHPDPEHPKRPVQGMACPKSEVSGRRLWGLFAERFGTAGAFFADHFVANYCPLAFMADTARNITPDKLPAAESEPLFEACSRHLHGVVETLQPELLVAVGGFAETRLRTLFGDSLPIARILHPSPASPAANRGWAEAATRQLVEQGVWDS